MLCHNNSVFQECGIYPWLSLPASPCTRCITESFVLSVRRPLSSRHSQSFASQLQPKQGFAHELFIPHAQLPFKRLGRGLDFNSDYIPESYRFKSGDFLGVAIGEAVSAISSLGSLFSSQPITSRLNLQTINTVAA